MKLYVKMKEFGKQNQKLNNLVYGQKKNSLASEVGKKNSRNLKKEFQTSKKLEKGIV